MSGRHISFTGCSYSALTDHGETVSKHGNCHFKYVDEAKNWVKQDKNAIATFFTNNK